jgi:hypothetical protein
LTKTSPTAGTGTPVWAACKTSGAPPLPWSMKRIKEGIVMLKTLVYEALAQLWLGRAG